MSYSAENGVNIHNIYIFLLIGSLWSSIRIMIVYQMCSKLFICLDLIFPCRNMIFFTFFYVTCAFKELYIWHASINLQKKKCSERRSRNSHFPLNLNRCWKKKSKVLTEKEQKETRLKGKNLAPWRWALSALALLPPL